MRWFANSFSVLGTIFVLATTAAAFCQDSQWVLPGKAGDPLIWGRRDGIVFGLFSQGGIRGPRGLIRVGVYPSGASSPELLNFIAVEPVVRGPGDRFDRMAFSELEMSELDPGKRGKRMWVDAETSASDGTPAGTLEQVHAGRTAIERLSVRIDVERFTAKGAHVYVIASIDSDHPYELQLRVYAEEDSPALDELTVTATMGNYERLRLLWLKDRTINSKETFGGYTGTDFIEGAQYSLPRMLRNNDGDAIVFCSSDEVDPENTEGNATAHWVYKLPKFTQYWRVPGHDVEPDLRVRVNARRVYWASAVPVLGGIAFENFEVRQRYIRGQTFIFGLTRREPWNFYVGPNSLKPFVFTKSAPDRPRNP